MLPPPCQGRVKASPVMIDETRRLRFRGEQTAPVVESVLRHQRTIRSTKKMSQNQKSSGT
jgi:hypothetical protein